MAEYLVKSESLTAIADAIRSKTDITNAISLNQMVTEIQNLSVGDGGTLTVNTLTGVTVTVSKDDKTFTEIADAEGLTVFKKLETGIWTVTISDGEQTSSKTVGITADYSLPMSFYHVYGISRDITLPSPEWAREDDAVGYTATASIGTTAGYSDFNECYPWNGIVRETFDTGDVMVKIPKFWFKRYLDGNIEHIKIADSPVEGFTLHPAFNHANVESDCIYVGAYRTSYNRNKAGSLPGKNPYYYGSSSGDTRDQHRGVSTAKGTNWGILDIATLSAIQMLILVEFANNDVQTVIGAGWNGGSSTPTLVTGTCDAVANLTGRPSGTEGTLDVVWRGIEGLWGLYCQYVDGIYYQNGTYYVCNDPSEYKDPNLSSFNASAYTALSYTLNGYSDYQGKLNFNRTVKILGVDTGSNSHVMMPMELQENGSTSEYFCDSANFYGPSPTMSYGGYYSRQGVVGLFALDFNYNNYMSRNSRLLYIPVKEVE